MTLTADQANSLRIALAERMGWQIKSLDYMEGVSAYNICMPLPDPLLCCYDAIALVEWMRTQGWLCSWDNITDRQNVDFYPRNRAGNHVDAQGDTFPLTVSLAAAKALGINIE